MKRSSKDWFEKNVPKKLAEQLLEKLGVGKLYGPGTPVNDTIEYIKDWVKKNR